MESAPHGRRISDRHLAREAPSLRFGHPHRYGVSDKGRMPLEHNELVVRCVRTAGRDLWLLPSTSTSTVLPTHSFFFKLTSDCTSMRR